MAHSNLSERLGPLDSLFLYLEKKEMPLHIGSVLVFDGPIVKEHLRALIEAKLPLIPRYRQRVVFPPFHAGYPTWEYDPEFDLERHIRGVCLQHGTQEELEDMAGQVFSEIMERGRPLWDLTVVDGLDNGRSALIPRVHHCLVDGIAGVALMNRILDTHPEPSPLPPARPFHAPPLPPAWASLTDAMVSSYFHTVERMLSLQASAFQMGAQWLSDLLGGSAGQTVPAMPEVLPPAQRFPFNAPIRGPRRLAWAEFSMQEINAMREACHVKVNDVGMMVLAGAMRRYARLHHQAVRNRLLRLMVPVNLRNDDQKEGFGNRISLVPVNIPLDIDDPAELLRVVHRRSDALKHANAANLIAFGGNILAMLPIPAQALMVGLLSNTVSVLPFDMVCTNVPGPPEALYLLGRKMLTYYPYVPIGDFMGVCCAMVSYNGTLYFGLTGDSASAPDLDRMRDFLKEAFRELQGALRLPVTGSAPSSVSGEPSEETAEAETLEVIAK